MSCSFAMFWGVPSWILNKNRPFWSLFWSPVSRHVCGRVCRRVCRLLATINIRKLVQKVEILQIANVCSWLFPPDIYWENFCNNICFPVESFSLAFSGFRLRYVPDNQNTKTMANFTLLGFWQPWVALSWGGGEAHKM